MKTNNVSLIISELCNEILSFHSTVPLYQIAKNFSTKLNNAGFFIITKHEYNYLNCIKKCCKQDDSIKEHIAIYINDICSNMDAKDYEEYPD